MEVVGYPSEGAPERSQALKVYNYSFTVCLNVPFFYMIQILNDLKGILDVKSGKMTKTGEEVTIAVFTDQDAAMQALQTKHSYFSLSIPRNNHAKFILSMLQNVV